MTVPFHDEVLAAAGAVLMWAGYVALGKLGKSLRKADPITSPSDSEESWQASAALMYEHERERQARDYPPEVLEGIFGARINNVEPQ